MHTIEEIRAMSPEEKDALQKQATRKLATHMLGFAAFKIALMLGVRALARRCAD